MTKKEYNKHKTAPGRRLADINDDIIEYIIQNESWGLIWADALTADARKKLEAAGFKFRWIDRYPDLPDSYIFEKEEK